LNDIPLSLLGVLLFLLLILSAFFSSSETSMMSLNAYRLRHLSKTKNGARRAYELLKRPDRLLGVILLGNNFVNNLAAALTTLIALRLEVGVIWGSITLTVVILIFGEVSPKTLAALYPEKVAFPAAPILSILLWIFYPLVWVINAIANALLNLFGISLTTKRTIPLTREELRTLVHETTGRISSAHQSMLLGILDLEKVVVDDIMVPRNEIIGLDITYSWKEMMGQLTNTQHTLIPVYKEDINNLLGILHIRTALNLLAADNFTPDTLESNLEAGYYIPDGTSVTAQLLNFQQLKKRLALVVNEYGDIQGLVTLADILEEIVGEFTTDMADVSRDIHPQADGSFLVDGSLTIRELNRNMEFQLHSPGPKTLSGLIIEQLQIIPQSGTCCLIDNIPVEVVQVIENRIKTVRLSPPLNPTPVNKQ
jgi:Mg2+/Co2+ transporter CorB